MIVGVLGLSLSGCKSAFEDSEYAYAGASNSTHENDSVVPYVPENPDDYNLPSDNSQVAYIHCKNDSFVIEGNKSLVDVKTTGVKVELKKSGTYYVDGILDDGQIQVDADSTAIVKVVLSGVSLNCTSKAPFRVKDCSKTIITIADGTTNTISDSKSNEDSAAIYSKRYLAFSGGDKGTGTLNVTTQSGGSDGIVCTKQLVFNSGKYNVSSIDDGIRGKLSLVIHDGDFTINANGDALKSTSSKEGYGYISIDNGRFDISSVDEGLQADGTINIKGGCFDIRKADKCIAALGDIIIDGGDLTLSPSVIIEDESGSGHGLCIKKNDDEARVGKITINGGDIKITNSFKGIQGVVITVNGGTVNVNSADDAFKASSGAGQKDDGGWGKRPDQQSSPAPSATKPEIIFNNGLVYIKSDGDGIDSNGEMHINGGVVLVSACGPDKEPITAGENCKTHIAGGVIVAAGAHGMKVAPEVSQTTFCASAAANPFAHTIAVNDANGQNIFVWTLPQQCQTITVSAPEIKTGSYYVLTDVTHKGNEYVSGLEFYYPATSASGTVSATISATEGEYTSAENNSGL